MEHLGIKALEAEQILLRRITLDDCKAMYDNWASLEECSRFFPWSAVKDIAAYQERVSAWVNNYENGLYFNWIIELKEFGEIIGIIKDL